MNYNKAEFVASYGLASQLPDGQRPEIVFSGRSNVGKSSLINKLCNRKSLARVSATPGKTATINFYRVDEAHLVDLPGYGYARVAAGERRRWDDLINRYFAAPRPRALLVQLLDCRHDPSADDRQMLEYLRYHGIPFVVALTKADKLNKSRQAAAEEQFRALCAPYGCRRVLLTSAGSGLGIEALRQLLDDAVRAARPGDSAPVAGAQAREADAPPAAPRAWDEAGERPAAAARNGPDRAEAADGL